MIYSIYKITNNCTAKSYVGMTKNLRKRLSDHRARRPDIFEGEDFSVDIIDSAATREQACVKEVAWIAKLRSNEIGYNRRTGGDKGSKQHAETREIMRKRNLGRKASPETREKMRLARIGKKLTAEHRANTSKGRKGCKSNYNPALRDDWPEAMARMLAGRLAAIEKRKLAKNVQPRTTPVRPYTVSDAVLQSRAARKANGVSSNAARKANETRKRKAKEALTKAAALTET